MNILIDTIRVAGFRGIKNLEVSLPRITVLIGTNNSGKTSLIKAFRLFFLMGMCEGIFPDYRAHGVKEILEERNNAFVAVTRAKRWVYIAYPQQRIMP